MRSILVLVFTLLYLYTIAQQRCISVENEYTQKFSKLANANTSLSAESRVDSLLSVSSPGSESLSPVVIRIPVVVHILYNSTDQNISDAQVNSQIEALNRDFRRRNRDTLNTPERFKRFAADAEIEFKLAVVDPRGYATNGIIRKQTSIKQWSTDDKIKFSAQGGDDAWDSKSYLNIWVGNVRKTLGYSSAMNNVAAIDGVVVANSAFGTIGKSGAYNMGRTVVHEVGHWLGLKHIWGDDACGDDEVDDTPKQAGFTSGCPKEFLSTCGNSALGDMYMNFMDFTDDPCMNMFTNGQKLRMRANFKQNGYRYSFLVSKGLDSSSIKEPSNDEVTKPVNDAITDNNKMGRVVLFPNPADKQINLSLKETGWIGGDVNIINISGVRLQTMKITSPTQTINIESLPKGFYFLLLHKNGEKVILKFYKS